MPKRVSVTQRSGRDALFSGPTPLSAPDQAPDMIKITVYVTPAHNLKLERLRLARLESGHRTDKSALVREALDLLH